MKKIAEYTFTDLKQSDEGNLTAVVNGDEVWVKNKD